jgi:hypothetical protein
VASVFSGFSIDTLPIYGIMRDMNTNKPLEYTWAVIRSNHTLGYVKHQSEWTAKRIAESNFGKDVMIERLYLVGLVPEGKVVSYSHT